MHTSFSFDDEMKIPIPGTVADIASSWSLKRRIGIVQLWPDRPVAEHECIERIARAAERIGVEVIKVNRIGYLVDDPLRQVTSDDVDFVLHLHYETPKTYDCYSIGALWNPIEFYFDWGYKVHASNQISHDDFVTAGATPPEDMIIRARPAEFARGSFPTLNHTLSEPVMAPQLRHDRRAFYCGINWEKVGGKPGRHNRLFEALDREGIIDIYGPNKIDGVHPWGDFNGYRMPLPFDGMSIIRAAARSGAVLVLSSEPHKNSGVMSNRLFECLASGSLIIGDSHRFLRDHFADCMLLIDDTLGPQEQACQAIEHIRWANANAERALDMIQTAQSRFIEQFMLDRQLLEVYRHFVAKRTARIAARAAANSRSRASICIIPIDKNPLSLTGTLEKLARQTMKDFEVIIATRGNLSDEDVSRLRATLPGSELKFMDVGTALDHPLGNFGTILAQLLAATKADVFCVAFGIERLFSTLVETMLDRLYQDGDVAGIRASGLLEHFDAAGRQFIDLNDPGWQPPHLGLVSMIGLDRKKYETARPLLDYVDCGTWSRLIALGLIGRIEIARTPLGILPLPEFEVAVRRLSGAAPIISPERVAELVSSYCSPSRDNDQSLYGSKSEMGAMDLVRGLIAQEFDLRMSSDTIYRLPEQQRMAFAFALYDSLPIPGAVKRALRTMHRWYCRVGSRIAAQRPSNQ